MDGKKERQIYRYIDKDKYINRHRDRQIDRQINGLIDRKIP